MKVQGCNHSTRGVWCVGGWVEQQDQEPKFIYEASSDETLVQKDKEPNQLDKQ